MSKLAEHLNYNYFNTLQQCKDVWIFGLPPYDILYNTLIFVHHFDIYCMSRWGKTVMKCSAYAFHEASLMIWNSCIWFLSTKSSMTVSSNQFRKTVIPVAEVSLSPSSLMTCKMRIAVIMSTMQQISSKWFCCLLIFIQCSCRLTKQASALLREGIQPSVFNFFLIAQALDKLTDSFQFCLI